MNRWVQRADFLRAQFGSTLGMQDVIDIRALHLFQRAVAVTSLRRVSYMRGLKMEMFRPYQFVFRQQGSPLQYVTQFTSSNATLAVKIKQVRRAAKFLLVQSQQNARFPQNGVLGLLGQRHLHDGLANS